MGMPCGAWRTLPTPVPGRPCTGQDRDSRLPTPAVSHRPAGWAGLQCPAWAGTREPGWEAAVALLPPSDCAPRLQALSPPMSYRCRPLVVSSFSRCVTWPASETPTSLA